ncbi:MAG: type II secretion system protein GspK [Candidatus Omnitrophica bacterium]|nr:type II secretion system protein GspK [Candidatus Omnitrophota bacterium]
MLFILSLLAFALAWRMSLEIRMTKHALYQLKDLYAAKSGVMRAMEVTRKDRIDMDSFKDKWANAPDLFKDIKVGDSSFTVSYIYTHKPDTREPVVYYGLIDEDRKINLNMDDLDKLGKALVNLRLTLKEESTDEPLLTEDIIDSILDWRDSDSEVRPQGAEVSYYKEFGYTCRNGKFSVLEELMLIRGMSKERFDRLVEYLTIYGSSDGKINVNTAGKEVLTAVILSSVANLSPTDALSIAGNIINWRQGESIYETADERVFETKEDVMGFIPEGDKEAFKDWLKLNSDYFRVNTEAQINRIVVKKAEAVYERSKNEILYWHED